jgi:hypothetical protein
MANCCLDTVYFYTDDNIIGLKKLEADLKACIDFNQYNENCWFGNLFEYNLLDTESYHLRGSVMYIEYEDSNIMIESDSAWTPMVDAYKKIAEFYGLQMVYMACEPGSLLYINSDISHRFMDARYYIRLYDEDAPENYQELFQKFEDGDTFPYEDELLQKFSEVGFKATSYKKLIKRLDTDYVDIHKFATE